LDFIRSQSKKDGEENCIKTNLVICRPTLRMYY
jgi:hypothetical protein